MTAICLIYIPSLKNSKEYTVLPKLGIDIGTDLALLLKPRTLSQKGTTNF